MGGLRMFYVRHEGQLMWVEARDEAAVHAAVNDRRHGFVSRNAPWPQFLTRDEYLAAGGRLPERRTT